MTRWQSYGFELSNASLLTFKYSINSGNSANRLANEDEIKNRKSVRSKLINFEKISRLMNFIPFWSRNINLGIFDVRFISGYNSLKRTVKSLFSVVKLNGHSLLSPQWQFPDTLHSDMNFWTSVVSLLNLFELNSLKTKSTFRFRSLIVGQYFRNSSKNIIGLPLVPAISEPSPAKKS